MSFDCTINKDEIKYKSRDNVKKALRLLQHNKKRITNKFIESEQVFVSIKIKDSEEYGVIYKKEFIECINKNDSEGKLGVYNLNPIDKEILRYEYIGNIRVLSKQQENKAKETFDLISAYC